VPPISKLLFYGPPGCGKTLCAYVLAAEIGIPLMYVRFDALVSSFLGETAGNIRRVFDLAKDNSYVIFFDEFDAIGRSRNDATEHGEIKRVVNTFLQQIDRFSGHSLIVAATNFEQSLDYAIWRRFDDTMYFALPTNEEKERLFSLRLQQFNGPVQAIKEYLNLTQTFSHADIENVCRMIMRKCILDGKRSYTKKEIELAVKKQKQLVQLRKSQYSD
jgi:SpoVK/Ycf46/Vps4 family AAA+-type ATPase